MEIQIHAIFNLGIAFLRMKQCESMHGEKNKVSIENNFRWIVMTAHIMLCIIFRTWLLGHLSCVAH